MCAFESCVTSQDSKLEPRQCKVALGPPRLLYSPNTDSQLPPPPQKKKELLENAGFTYHR